MRGELVACDNCEQTHAGIVGKGDVHDGWLQLVIYSAQIGKEQGPVNLVSKPVVVDLCSPACAQAWATKLFETIFGKVEMKTESPDSTTVPLDSTCATSPPEA
jgi:hypothetical protein